MAMAVPVPLIRRNYVLRKLRSCGADCAERAVSLREAGVFNPDGFPMVTRMMVRQGLLRTTDGERYFVT